MEKEGAASPILCVDNVLSCRIQLVLLGWREINPQVFRQTSYKDVQRVCVFHKACLAL